MADIDIKFLPLVYEIIKSVEKDAGDVSSKINDLRVKFQQVREAIEKLPGIECSAEEQSQLIENYHKQLEDKSQLLIKYKDPSQFSYN